jgi:hypothetical protein
MSITLDDIEKAIRSNFVINKEGKKILETVYDWESNSLYTARIVFVGIALQHGFSMEPICQHLDMTYKEYTGKVKKYKQLLRLGEQKYFRIQHQGLKYDKDITDNLDLRVYRKQILINNYLNNLQHVPIITS